GQPCPYYQASDAARAAPYLRGDRGQEGHLAAGPAAAVRPRPADHHGDLPQPLVRGARPRVSGEVVKAIITCWVASVRVGESTPPEVTWRVDTPARTANVRTRRPMEQVQLNWIVNFIWGIADD